jgi:hypothetical protein
MAVSLFQIKQGNQQELDKTDCAANLRNVFSRLLGINLSDTKLYKMVTLK